MNAFVYLACAVILIAAEPLSAQQRPKCQQQSLTEPDQELDGFSGGYAKIHRISAQLRGVRGADSTLYRVSSDGCQLTAYKRGKQLWQTNIAKEFTHSMLTAAITSIVLSSAVVFISTTSGGYAEVDRATGKVGATDITTE